MGKRKRDQSRNKSNVEAAKEEEGVILKAVVSSDEPPLKQVYSIYFYIKSIHFIYRREN